MSQFSVTYLGCGSATPTLRHLPSCQVLDFRGNLLMVDCGEGAQLSMRRWKLSFSRLNHIFISHLHGDHCLGLPGLVSTLALAGREGRPLTIHTFRDGAAMFDRMIRFFSHEIPFDVRYDIIDHRAPAGEVIMETDSLTVSTFPLYHRLPCVGFLFKERPKLRHLRGDMVKFHSIPLTRLRDIKEGAPYVTPDGRLIPNEWLTTDPDPVHSYACCSDTLFDLRVARAVEGVETLYHEATYTEDMRQKAFVRGHSTALQAAEAARIAGARRLVLGHYSKRYSDEAVHLAEARRVFPDTLVSYEGLKLRLD